MTPLVLVVDNEKGLLILFSSLVQRMGYEVLQAESGMAALAILEQQTPDLMILDINMPEVTGLDLLEFMRRRADIKDLPVVMLSTEASDVMIDRATELGADAYVSKPVTIEELERAMQEAFEKRKSEKR